MSVGDYLACVVVGAQYATDEIVKSISLRASNLDRVIRWRRERDVSQRHHHVVRKDWLHEHWRDVNRLPVAAGIGNAPHEFEELSGPEDRVGNPGGLDQILLVIFARK